MLLCPGLSLKPNYNGWLILPEWRCDDASDLLYIFWEWIVGQSRGKNVFLILFMFVACQSQNSRSVHAPSYDTLSSQMVFRLRNMALGWWYVGLVTVDADAQPWGHLIKLERLHLWKKFHFPLFSQLVLNQVTTSLWYMTYRGWRLSWIPSPELGFTLTRSFPRIKHPYLKLQVFRHVQRFASSKMSASTAIQQMAVQVKTVEIIGLSQPLLDYPNHTMKS